jgi:peptidoglycan/LPS O-acetylase OafA/YrhL
VHNLPLLPTSVRFWVANLLLLQYELGTTFADSAFWSLSYEIAFYAIVGVMLLLAKAVAARRGPAVGIMMLMLSITGSTCLSLLVMIVRGRAMFPFGLWHQFALGGVLFFLLEANPRTMAGETKRFRFALWATSAAVIALTLTFTVVWRNWDGNYAHPSSRAATTLCLAFCIVLAGLRRFDTRLSRARWMHPLLWLGASSYSLYLIHPIILPYVDILTRRAGLDGDLYWISFWIQFAVAIVAGRVFYWIVEKHFVSARQRERLREEHVA